MIRFNCDYLEGAHPSVMARLNETNLMQTVGYGEDECCDEARRIIRSRCKAPDAAIHFLMGGTQTNLTLIDAALRPYQGVLCADSGHINVHETGAIEACGHKVIGLMGREGKLAAGQVSDFCRRHYADSTHEHQVMPKLVYISFPTEIGTIYSRNELLALRGVCDNWGLYLYIDGARLGFGMAARECDVDMPFLYEVSDAFYIGGTKQGALFGEALVIRNRALQADFRYMIKQKGGMLAKGRLLGLQFEALLRDSLYEEISRKAVAQAIRIREAFRGKGCPFLIYSSTNQQFPILSNDQVRTLSQRYGFAEWERVDDRQIAVRFCTSWATRDEDVDALIADIRAM